MRSMAWALAAMAVLALAGTEASAQGRTKITVYTAFENEQLKPLKDAFEKDVPDVEIAWVRDSTGVITARFLAEKDNPRADVVWGVAATSLMLADDLKLLDPYAPKGLDQVKASFKDSKSPPTWVGFDAWVGAICFNTAEAGKKSMPKPAKWADLVKPEYKGAIVMPNPASSGTGYLTVSAWIQGMGEAQAWEFMTKLHENIAVYTHSGSKPCKMAGAGEFAVGISFEYPGAKEKTKGAPVEVVLPGEGSGWEMEATGIVKGTKNAAAAKKLADWAIGKHAMEVYNETYVVLSVPGIAKMPPNYPPDVEKMMIKNDFTWAAKNRERILAEWTKRFDAKSEKKS